MWQCFLNCQMPHIFSKILHLINYEWDKILGYTCTDSLLLPSNKMHIQANIWDGISYHTA